MTPVLFLVVIFLSVLTSATTQHTVQHKYRQLLPSISLEPQLNAIFRFDFLCSAFNNTSVMDVCPGSFNTSRVYVDMKRMDLSDPEMYYSLYWEQTWSRENMPYFTRFFRIKTSYFDSDENYRAVPFDQSSIVFVDRNDFSRFTVQTPTIQHSKTGVGSLLIIMDKK